MENALVCIKIQVRVETCAPTYGDLRNSCVSMSTSSSVQTARNTGVRRGESRHEQENFHVWSLRNEGASLATLLETAEGWCQAAVLEEDDST